jgi:hypothetical protein
VCDEQRWYSGIDIRGMIDYGKGGKRGSKVDRSYCDSLRSGDTNLLLVPFSAF